MTSAIDLLFRIRSPWLEDVARSLAQGENLRHSISDEISRFFDSLAETLVTGDYAALDTFLQGWLERQAASEVLAEDEDRPPDLIPVLHALRAATLDTACANLSAEEALDLISALDHVFAHATEYLARCEVRQGMQSVTARMAGFQQALERLDRSKSNFIGVAAHELKTPLTLIEGYSQMMGELLGEDDPQGQIMLDGITKGIKRLQEIVDDMIDVSMIDNDMLSLHYQPVWLNRLLELAQQDLRPVILERGHTLEVRPFPGSDEMTYADPERLLQAILNVLGNAVKYTPDGGRITVDGRRLPGFVEMTVSDTGIGINPEDQAHIFEKFNRLGNPQLHSSGKTKYLGGGPGLGLPIAKGILEGHGGAIWVESPGCDEESCPGSTFHLMIPLRSTPPSDRSEQLFGRAGGLQ